MVDIHCHILPRMDDGSRSLGESVAMARTARASGVDKIAATPHFAGTEESLQDLPRILSRVRRLEQELEHQGIDLEIVPGGEILCMPQTLDLAKRDMLPTLGDSRYLLTEFYFDFPGEEMNRILDAVKGMDYLPIVAHPERYGAVQREPELVYRWFDREMVIQVNKGSVLGSFGSAPEQCAQLLLDRGMVHVIASDGHRADSRTTDMSTVRAWAEEQLGRTYADVLLRRNPGLILRGKPTLAV